MFKKTDPYSFSNFSKLYTDAARKNPIGVFSSDYQVTSYDDVQMKDYSTIDKRNRKFLVHCTQRINIFNISGMNLSPTANKNSYLDYPVLINTIVEASLPESSPGAVDFQLLEYSPQTVNTKIQQSGATTGSNGTTNTLSNTIGSSTSETNSYGATVTIGAAELNDSISANYEHSSTTSNDHSQTKGSESSASKSRENSSSMSMKDWGAYSLVNPATKFPSWTFGQEYPWDAIECRTSNSPDPSGQSQIVIPAETQSRLWDNIRLYPPSQLSMFGVNFVMKSLWLITVDKEPVDSEGVQVEFTHAINYFSGSHKLENGLANVYMDQNPTMLYGDNDDSLSPTLDLTLMGIDPISRDKPAVIGFIPNKFVVKPEDGSFLIASTCNNLLITDTTSSQPSAGQGFTSSETALTATVSGTSSLQMTISFKVIDTVNDYTLFIKHWKKSGSDDILLSFIFNDDKVNAITKYVTAMEAEGGENNLLSINLRNQEYATIDYHDYLQLGLNKVDVVITPVSGQPTSDCAYQIRAISIEKK